MKEDIFFAFASALGTAVGATLLAWLPAPGRSGRLARTLDQATKVIDFVKQCTAAYDGIAKIAVAKRSDVEKLMLDAIQAVQKDLSAERVVLPEFEKNTSSVRRALLIYLPSGTIIWLPFLLFHTLLLFILYVFVIRVVVQGGQWKWDDTVVVLVAGVCAALVRLAVRLFPHRSN
jgi:hypothetical protein